VRIRESDENARCKARHVNKNVKSIKIPAADKCKCAKPFHTHIHTYTHSQRSHSVEKFHINDN